MTTETSIYEYAKQGLSHGADRTAIWFYGRSISYGELFEKIDNIANNLYTHGVRRGMVVTIHLPTCPQAVMAIYAVAKLGGICNMVHALTPEAALRENMRHTQSRYLITFSEARDFDDCSVFLVDVSRYTGVFQKLVFRMTRKTPRGKGQPFFSLEKKAITVCPPLDQKELANDCAVYLHSSGTTGIPKTVMQSHASINRSVGNAVDYYRLLSRTHEKVLCVLPLFHGMGLAHVMHISLSGGAELLQMASWDLRTAVNLVDRHQATLIVGVPKIFSSLLSDKHFSGKSLTHCFVAGENVTPELKRSFNQRVQKRSCLYEAYGMTEIVVGACSCSAEHDNLLSCGYPVTNCRMAVWDGKNEPKSVGEGELIVSINTFMLGYLNDPTATEDAFLQWNHEKWLKTGDLGRIDDDGYVYFIDRIKNIIKHNGYNLFPLEIEKITKELRSVADICVIGVPEENGTQKVTAYIGAGDAVESERLKEQIRAHWLKQLPRYAIPEDIIIVPELPRNLMGKVDREALKSRRE